MSSIGSVSVEVELKSSKNSSKNISQDLESAFSQANRAISELDKKSQKAKDVQQKKEQAQRLKKEKEYFKQRQKYELQFARQTKNKEKAIAMANERMAIREKNALYADQLDHQDKLNKALEKKKSLAQQVASGAFWGSLGGNLMSGGLKKATSFIGEQVQTLERRELNRYFGESYGPNAQKQAINTMLKTGVDIDDFARSVKRLDEVVGGRGALSLSQKIADLADPLYDFGQQIGDVEGILRGASIDTAGSFAKRYGQGNARMLNATMERQKMLVEAGVYQDMNESTLIKEREARLNGILGRAKSNYEVDSGVVMARAVESAKTLGDEEVARQSIGVAINSAKKAGVDLNPEALATNVIAGKSINTANAGMEGDVMKLAANSISLLNDGFNNFTREWKKKQEERKLERELAVSGGGYANDVAR